jgi:pSer/pThr/pTyr-binding forkhead associated (FHA) protein
MTPFLELRLGLKTVEISEGNPVVTIGRDPTNDLELPEVHVSRNHCRIERTEHDILLTDSSVNGTIVVTDDKQEILIKNGSISLKGKGMIFLGRPFMGERRGGLHYELIRYESFP